MFGFPKHAHKHAPKASLTTIASRQVELFKYAAQNDLYDRFRPQRLELFLSVENECRKRANACLF
jgi:hypothetical protein